MGKRKKRREEKPKFKYTVEVWSLSLIIISILGIGLTEPLGLVGRLARCFAVFLVGTWDVVLLAACLIVGIYMLLKKEIPSFFTSRLIGLYIFLIGILVFSHMNFIDSENLEALDVFQATFNILLDNFNSIMNKAATSPSGGGFLGCLLAIAFNKLFDLSGTKIVAIILMTIGICLFTGVSLIDLIKKGFNKTKKILPTKHHISIEDDEEIEPAVIINDNSSNKIVVSSLEELHSETKEEKSEEPISPSYDNGPTIYNHNYKLPPLSILDMPKKTKDGANNASIEKNIVLLEKVLKDFDIYAKVVEVNSGPRVTQYELEVQSGTKLNRITSISKEISLALAKKDVRIQAPIPGKGTVGIEMANDIASSVSLREILETVPASKKDSKLLVALGKNIMGSSIYTEIDKTPHMLVAGSTGSGKSVCINGMIVSILMRSKPDEVRLVLVDPKKVEFTVYNGVPHLMMPVVTDPKKASVALQKIVNEMENRYNIFSDKNVKNIATYNEWVDKENLNLSPDNQIKHMPYIVVIIDELADLMMVASKEVEDSVMRITQMARAAGIHLIIATQRPSTDVITGVVKVNIPSRIAFAVSSNVDSRTILDMSGAEKLLGKGDMLFLPMGENSPQRVQGAYVSDDEIKKVVDYTVSQQKATYDENFMNLNSANEQGNLGGEVVCEEEEYDDPIYDDVVEFIVRTGKASASLLQRKFKLGYNRAARIIDLLEERGIIGPQNGSKPREVLVELNENKDE